MLCSVSFIGFPIYVKGNTQQCLLSVFLVEQVTGKTENIKTDSGTLHRIGKKIYFELSLTKKHIPQFQNKPSTPRKTKSNGKNRWVGYEKF